MKWRRQADKLLPLGERRRGGWKKKADKQKDVRNKPSGACAGGRASRLVHETVGCKWLANQIWSGMRGRPEGKHQVHLYASWLTFYRLVLAATQSFSNLPSFMLGFVNICTSCRLGLWGLYGCYLPQSRRITHIREVLGPVEENSELNFVLHPLLYLLFTLRVSAGACLSTEVRLYTLDRSLVCMAG